MRIEIERENDKGFIENLNKAVSSVPNEDVEKIKSMLLKDCMTVGDISRALDIELLVVGQIISNNIEQQYKFKKGLEMSASLGVIDIISKRVAKHKREIARIEKESIRLGGIPVENDRKNFLKGCIADLLWASRVIEKDSQTDMDFGEELVK